MPSLSAKRIKTLCSGNPAGQERDADGGADDLIQDVARGCAGIPSAGDGLYGRGDDVEGDEQDEQGQKLPDDFNGKQRNCRLTGLVQAMNGGSRSVPMRKTAENRVENIAPATASLLLITTDVLTGISGRFFGNHSSFCFLTLTYSNMPNPSVTQKKACTIPVTAPPRSFVRTTTMEPTTPALSSLLNTTSKTQAQPKSHRASRRRFSKRLSSRQKSSGDMRYRGFDL